MSSITSMVAAIGPTNSTPRGPPSMSSTTSVVAAIGPADSTLRGPAINALQQVVAVASVSSANASQGATSKHYHSEQDIFIVAIFFQILAMLRTQRMS
jgi:hypothetical protein